MEGLSTRGDFYMLIYLKTFIKANPQIVFDLSRSIDLHVISTADTKEDAIAGKISGLMNVGETVTWRARHLFKNRTMTVKITAMEPYEYFCDEMLKGDFEKFKHQHWFWPVDNGTVMEETIEFSILHNFAGKLFGTPIVKNYIAGLIKKRNEVIRQYAEWGGWHSILEKTPPIVNKQMHLTDRYT